MIIVPILGSLIQLVILGLIVVLIVRAVGRRTGGADREGTGVTIRRFFHYTLMLAVLGVVAAGVTGLIVEILPRDGEVLREETANLARSLAFLLVGGPVLAALAIWARRLLTVDPQERGSLGWAFYLTGALTGSLFIAGFALFRTFRWVLAESDFDAASLSVAVVASVVWGVHWWVADRYGSPPRLELNTIVGSAAGLVTTAVAIAFAITIAAGELYDAAFDTFVVESLGDGLRVAAAGVIVAIPIWWWHWHRHGLYAERTSLWHGYVLLFGVLGALVTVMIAAGTMLYLVLAWFFGDPDVDRAAAFFDPLPASVAALVVGAAAWWYHRLVLGPSGERAEIDRVYDYLLSGAGLAAAAGGAVTLVAAIVEVATPGGGALAESGESNVLVTGLTLLVVGVPLWLYHWTRIRRVAAAAPEVELVSPARRVYLLLLTGIGALVAVFSVLAIVIVGLEDLLEGSLGWETVRDLRVGLGLAVTFGAGAAFHWTIFTRDRAEAPAVVRPAVRDVVLVCSDGAGVAAAIADQVGARVRVWHRLDEPAGGELPAEEVVAAVRAETHEHVMVLAGGAGGFEVVPFDDR